MHVSNKLAYQFLEKRAKSTITFPYAKPNPSHLSDPASSILNRPITAARCTAWCTAASSGIAQRWRTAVRRVTRGRSARTGSARRRILTAGAGQDARRQRSNRAGSAATGILAAGAEPDTCGHVRPRRRRPRLGAEGTILRRRRVTPPLLEGGTRSRYWPTPLHRGGQRPLHGPTAPPPVALQRPRPPLPRRRSRRPRHCRMVPMPTPPSRSRGWATSAPKPVPDVYSAGGLNGASDGAAGSASADGCQAGAGEAVSPVATPAPKPAPGVYSAGGLPGASAEAVTGASADGSAAGAGMPVSPLVSPAPEPAPGVSPDGGSSGVSTGAAAHTARDSVHSRYQSRLGATFLRLSGAMYGNATVDAAITAIRSPDVVATSSHLLQIDHLLPVAQGGGPNLFNFLLCFAHHSLRHGHGSAAPPERPM